MIEKPAEVFIFAKILYTISTVHVVCKNTCTFILEFCHGENMQKKNDKKPKLWSMS
jgi:hypothetical protein